MPVDVGPVVRCLCRGGSGVASGSVVSAVASGCGGGEAEGAAVGTCVFVREGAGRVEVVAEGGGGLCGCFGTASSVVLLRSRRCPYWPAAGFRAALRRLPASKAALALVYLSRSGCLVVSRWSLVQPRFLQEPLLDGWWSKQI